jgi:hypothetical protein
MPENITRWFRGEINLNSYISEYLEISPDGLEVRFTLILILVNTWKYHQMV